MSVPPLSAVDLQRLDEALSAARYSYCGGRTHGFYHYPARFSPEIARTAIEIFSAPGQVVLDPFMGGGTSIIEGLCLGRRMLGVDINSLAVFVSATRTTPLSAADAAEVKRWAAQAPFAGSSVQPDPGATEITKNVPPSVAQFVADALSSIDALRFPRQRSFARCVLLRLGQWALDCRDFEQVPRGQLGPRLVALTDEMLQGLSEFVETCQQAGVAKNAIVRNRQLLCRSAVGLEHAFALGQRPSLVVTSPPYPSVHVLYHRWQYRGRRETPAPYWIAGVPDGHYESYYTGGSRTPTGRTQYFRMIEAAFKSVRQAMDPTGTVIQLVGFSHAAAQLPQYLASMAAAGFEEALSFSGTATRLQRRVPNRKWYAKLKGCVDASSEVLLIHRPSL